jgi:hypothetical protein
VAEEQFTGDIEIFDLRAVVNVHVRKNSPKPIDRCRLISSRYEEEYFSQLTIDGAKKPLRTERGKQVRKNRMNTAEADRSIGRILNIRAHLKSRAWCEKDRTPRGVGVEKIRRQEVRIGNSLRYRVPINFSPAGANEPPTPLLFPKKALNAFTSAKMSEGLAPDASKTVGSAANTSIGSHSITAVKTNTMRFIVTSLLEAIKIEVTSISRSLTVESWHGW